MGVLFPLIWSLGVIHLVQRGCGGSHMTDISGSVRPDVGLLGMDQVTNWYSSEGRSIDHNLGGGASHM